MPHSIFSDAHRVLVEALKRARKETGLTQAQLGQRVGKNQKFISLIEQGQRRVDLIEFYALARAMKLSPLRLFQLVIQNFPDDLKM
jgi:transcriptional regulator with XRE-family HTH domain